MPGIRPFCRDYYPKRLQTARPGTRVLPQSNCADLVWKRAFWLSSWDMIPPYSPRNPKARYRIAVRNFGGPLKARLQLAWVYRHLVASSTRVPTCGAIGAGALPPYIAAERLQRSTLWRNSMIDPDRFVRSDGLSDVIKARLFPRVPKLRSPDTSPKEAPTGRPLR